MNDVVTPRSHDLTGVVLGGRYEVLGRLGVGGMASVYEGRRVGLHNRVAIKVLRPDLCEDPSNVKRFLREARASSVIEHENIVDIVDFGPTDAFPVYFVMEFLEGTDLRLELKAIGRMSWSRARRILSQVVGALGAAHEKAIVHRDVKPANIFLIRRAGGEEVAKVLDFGIAKVIEEQKGGLTHGHTATNGLLGTVAYMAPEQARGGPIDARTDVYAVGVVAYQMLTGQAPFRGNNPYVVLEQHVTELPRPPRELNPDLPPSAEAIILRCLEKAPEARFQSMAELAAALARTTATMVPGHVSTPAWTARPSADDDGSDPIQSTAALGSGVAFRGAQTASSAPAPTLAGNTVAMPQPPEPVSSEERPVGRGRLSLPILLGAGIVIGLLVSVSIVAFIHEPTEALDPPAPSAAPAPKPTPPPEPAERNVPAPAKLPPPETKPPPTNAADAAASKPDPHQRSVAQHSESDRDPPPIRRRRKTKAKTPSKRANEPKTTAPPTDPPTPEAGPEKKELHPDLRDPYG